MDDGREQRERLDLSTFRSGRGRALKPPIK